MKRKIFYSVVFLFFITLPSFAHFVHNVNAIETDQENYTLYGDSSCAEIVLRSGQLIEGVVKKITPEVIEYVKCKQNAPIYTVRKSEVLMIKYPDGRVEQFLNTNSNTGKTGAIIAFVLSIIGLFLLSFVFGIISFIWGLVSLSKMNKIGTKGKGWAIAAMIIGGLEVFVMLIYLASI